MATESHSRSAAGGPRKKLTVSGSSTSSTLGDNEDVLIEILTRLPDHKSAFRCKLVCNGWNSLISAPYFHHRFVSHHHTLPADETEHPVLTPPQLRESILSFLPFPDETQSTFSVLDCVKDLVLLGFWPGQETDRELLRTYLVCNPFTKQWVALPLAPKMSVRPTSRARWIVKLVCEPAISPGDGQLLFPCRFRAVRMYNPERSTSSRVELYMFCSRSGRWTKSAARFDCDLRCDKFSIYLVVSEKGKLYWLNRRGRVVEWDPFCLDPTTALPILMDGSELGYQHYSCYFYGPWISEGALHVIFKGLGYYDELSVWRLGEENGGGGWRKQYEVISLGNLRMRDLNLRKWGLETERRVIGLHPEKPEIVFMLVFSRHHDLPTAILSLDLRKKEFELLDYLGKGPCGDDEQIFQPRVHLWPNLISSYEKLQNVYNGSYNCWLPSSDESTS